jgi:hypothetical protein
VLAVEFSVDVQIEMTGALALDVVFHFLAPVVVLVAIKRPLRVTVARS